RRRHGITQSTSETHTAGGGAPGGTPHVSRACRRAWCGRPRWDRRSRGIMDTLWHEVWTGIYTDFSDLPGVRELTQLLLRLGLAASLGSLLGFQREIVGRAAGLRTHMLVALGSAFFILLPVQAGMDLADLSRVLQGLTTGIGFLGAGTILKREGQI